MQLLEFPHSHYCEAARWALDIKCVDYDRKALLPGLHKFQVERIAPQSSLPVLIDGDSVVQGSRAIIDYCDAQFGGPRLLPVDEGAAEAIKDLEERADKNIGIPLRAIIYDRLLGDRPAVEKCFMQGAPAYRRWLFRAMYPVTRRIIRKVYIPSQDYIETAKARFSDEIGRFDDMIAGREFLIGDRLTRADIMVASMFSIGVLPPEHSTDWPEPTDPELKAFRNQYLDRPTFAWVRQFYARYRNAPSASS